MDAISRELKVMDWLVDWWVGCLTMLGEISIGIVNESRSDCFLCEPAFCVSGCEVHLGIYRYKRCSMFFGSYRRRAPDSFHTIYVQTIQSLYESTRL
jgi:hypothetical protein